MRNAILLAGVLEVTGAALPTSAALAEDAARTEKQRAAAEANIGSPVEA